MVLIYMVFQAHIKKQTCFYQSTPSARGSTCMAKHTNRIEKKCLMMRPFAMAALPRCVIWPSPLSRNSNLGSLTISSHLCRETRENKMKITREKVVTPGSIYRRTNSFLCQHGHVPKQWCVRWRAKGVITHNTFKAW